MHRQSRNYIGTNRLSLFSNDPDQPYLEVVLYSTREDLDATFDLQIVSSMELLEEGESLKGSAKMEPKRASDVTAADICPYFQTRTCFKGERCKYFHFCSDCHNAGILAKHRA